MMSIGGLRRTSRARLPKVLGGISPIDPGFIENLRQQGALDCVDVVAVHGSSYYRHFYMGLLREDGSPKRALAQFSDYTPALGLCQWFHFEDHRLDDAVRWLKRLGVKHLRTGLSWADSFRPNADAWFDRQMLASMKASVTRTDTLKLRSRAGSRLASMKCSMSG